MNVVGDDVSHTSDYFEQLHAFAIDMIKAGKAYADDTDATELVTIPCSCTSKSHGALTQMAFDRFHGISSARRDATVEENLQRFADMTAGEARATKWCLRAKIDMSDPNKAMRDPVIYRSNPMPHHRTGCVISRVRQVSTCLTHRC
jgi:glutamyl-tRNA synthetase